MIPQVDLTPIFVLLAISVPLALWKVVDIVVWLCHHVHINWV